MSLPALHCQRVGTGPDLVLVHGWGLHAGIWAPLIESLTAHFRLHLYDLPGYGRSAPIDAFTFDSVCTQLAQEVPQQACWLGWSMGGLIALEFAARYPARVEKLLLVASTPRFVATDNVYPGMAPEVLEKFAADLVADHGATLKRFLSLVARGAEDSSVLRVLRHAMQDAPLPTEATLRGGLAMLRDTDLRDRLARLEMPVAWLAGARDTLVPVAALQQLTQDYPSMSLVIFEQAGHAPFISHPRAFAAAVLEFLQ